MYFGDHPVGNTKWGVHLEAQIRRASYGTSFQQVLLRPGLNYSLNKNFTGTVGYGFAESFPYGDYPSTTRRFPEHRVYEQLLIRNWLGKVAVQHRLRNEQRWLQLPAGTGHWQTRQRFRYMLRGDIPLPSKILYLAFYDEVFWNYGGNSGLRALDQNRAYGVLGFKLSRFEKLEVGYLHQYVPQRNGRVFEHNHTLQVALFSSRPLRIGRR